MRLRYLTTAGLLLGFATPVFAQDTAPLPRFYAGLTAYSSRFQPLGGQSYLDGSQNTVPVQAVVGYQLRPRWAVQLGAAYSGYRRPYSYLGNYSSPSGTSSDYYSYNGTYTVRKLSVTLLGRYTITRTPTHRFQVDALGGLTNEYSSVRDAGIFASNLKGQLLTNDYGSVTHDYRLLAGIGSGLRLRAARRLDVMLDVMLNLPIYGPGYFDLTSATALGLRYRFGQPN